MDPIHSSPNNDMGNRGCNESSILSHSNAAGMRKELDGVFTHSKMKKNIERTAVGICSRKRKLLNQYINEQVLESSLIAQPEKQQCQNNDIINCSNNVNKHMEEGSSDAVLSQNSIDLKIDLNDVKKCSEKVGNSETICEQEYETTRISPSQEHNDVKLHTDTLGVLATGVMGDNFLKRPPNIQQSKKPNTLISDTEKCKVCLAPAGKHVHYGATTCFSCRAFFRRSIQTSQSRAYVCRRKGNCTISRDTRKACQRCRFERCIKIGMNPGWVLNDDERARRFHKVREKKNNQLHQQQLCEIKIPKYPNRETTVNNAIEEQNTDDSDSLTAYSRRRKLLLSPSKNLVEHGDREDILYGRKRMYLQLRQAQEEEDEESSLLHCDTHVQIPFANREPNTIMEDIHGTYPPMRLPFDSETSPLANGHSNPITSPDVNLWRGEYIKSSISPSPPSPNGETINLSLPRLTTKTLEMFKDYEPIIHHNHIRRTASSPFHRNLKPMSISGHHKLSPTSNELASVNNDPVARIFYHGNPDLSSFSTRENSFSPSPTSSRFVDVTSLPPLSSAKPHQFKQKPSATFTSSTGSSISPIMHDMPPSTCSRLGSIRSTSNIRTFNATSCRIDAHFPISKEETDNRQQTTSDKRYTSPTPGPSYSSCTTENLVKLNDRLDSKHPHANNTSDDLLQTFAPSSTCDKRHTSRSSHSQADTFDSQSKPHLRLVSRIPALFVSPGEAEINVVHDLVSTHDMHYRSINFGEDVIKEMLMSSIFGIPVSAKAAMTAYRLMIQRVTRVAQNFNEFLNLPYLVQGELLKHNADLVVSLRGAVFFELKKQGLDQILSSLGIDDLESARTMINATLKTHNTLKRIDYKTFNTIQEKADNTAEEIRYDELLYRVGATVAFNPNLVKILSYILLFCVDFQDERMERGGKKIVEDAQKSIIGMLERYLSATYPHDMANTVFSEMMSCMADLRELCWIKKQRRLSKVTNSTPSPPLPMQ